MKLGWFPLFVDERNRQGVVGVLYDEENEVQLFVTAVFTAFPSEINNVIYQKLS